jgi:hypothetical protein
MRWCQYRRSPARNGCGLGFCGSAKIGDGTGHGDSGVGGSRVLYDEVNVGEVAGDECISAAESGVGRKDRGEQGRFGGDDNSSV